MAQACELLRSSDRSSSHAAIMGDTSNAKFPNSAQSTTTSSNNCAITTPCAPGNTGNPRRRHKYSSGLHAFQGNWRVAIPGNAVDPPSYLWNFDHITGAPRSTLPNTQVTSLAGINVRRLLLNKRLPLENSCSRDLTSTRRDHNFSSLVDIARRTRRLKQLVRRPSTDGYIR